MEKRYHYITPEDYETAAKNGITKGALDQRVDSYGWDIDKAITEPMRTEIPFQPIWEKWEHIATKNGVTKKRFYHRIKTNKWTEKEAATYRVGQNKRESRWTAEDREIAKRNGVDGNHLSLVAVRIDHLGWSKEEALNTPKLSLEERAKRVAAGTRKHHKKVKVGNQ